MWLWGTLFDLGKTAIRGVGCLWFGAIGIIMFGGLVTTIATSAIRSNPDEAAALAISAAADIDRREAREWVRDSDRRRARRGSVASQWERDRREAEYYEKYDTPYYDDY